MPKRRTPSKKSPIIPPKQERSRATFDAIVTATAYLLEERGFTSFGTNEIAERAGVNINSFYQYFLNRDAAVLECANRALDQEEQAFFACLKEAEKLTERDGFTHIVDSMIEHFSNQTKLKREIFFHIATIIGPERQQLRRRRFAESLLKFIPVKPDTTTADRQLVSFVIVQAFLGAHFALWEPDMPKRQRVQVQGEIKKLILRYVS